MEYIMNINAQGSKVDAFLNFIKSLDFVEIFEANPQTTTTKEQQRFKKKLFTALQEAEDVRAGKIEAIPFEDFINEL